MYQISVADTLEPRTDFGTGIFFFFLLISISAPTQNFRSKAARHPPMFRILHYTRLRRYRKQEYSVHPYGNTLIHVVCGPEYTLLVTNKL